MDSAIQTALALLPISLIGAVLNWSILYSIYKLSFFKNSFGYLSANQAFVDALHSTMFLFYFCPMVLLDQKLMKDYSFIIGFIILFCYQTSVLTHFVISINRFCAVWVPFKYEKWFGLKRTKLLIALQYILNGTLGVYCYLILCRVGYLEKVHFIFMDSEYCEMVTWYEDFVKNGIMITIIVFIDVTTVLRVRHVSKHVRSLNGDDGDNFTKRDIRFLKQTVFQVSVFLLELLAYFFVPIYFQNQWIIFFGTSFGWVAVHAADGMVVILCSPEVRKYLLGDTTVHSQLNTQTDMTMTN